MKTSLKIKLLNVLVAFCASLVGLFWIFSSVIGMLGSNDNMVQTDVIISASTEVVEVDKPLYNILSGSGTVSLQRVEISDKTDVINAFYAYFNNLQSSGGYAYEAYSTIAGTAKVAGISKTAYQASYMYAEVNDKGDYRFENGTAEVAGPNGQTTGMGRYQYDVFENVNGNLTRQQTTSVSASKMSNGQFKLAPNFNGTSASKIDETAFSLPFMFKLADNTISSCDITKNAFSYSVVLSLNHEGYLNMARHNAESAGASALPKLVSFKVNLAFDSFGRVLSLSYTEQYVIAVSVPVIGSVNANNVATWAVSIYTDKYSSKL